MISASKFYSSKNPSRYTTLLDDRSHAESSNIRNVVILPPDSGNLDIDGDIDKYPEISNVEDALLEPTGELEIEDSKSDDCSNDETVPPKISRNDNPRRRKPRTFCKDIPTTPTSNLSDTFPDLITKRPFDLWSSFITNELLEDVVAKSNLHAKQDKNDQAFELSKRELMRFLEIVLLSWYHSLPSEQHFWSNEPNLGVPIVIEAMSSKRFLKIKGMFHHVDDKKHTVEDIKLAPVNSSLNDAFVRYGIFPIRLSIDESMIPYF